MKVNRINIMIPANENQHKRLLYNEVLDIAQRYKIGGAFFNDYIKLNSMPENLTKLLDELKIKFVRL